MRVILQRVNSAKVSIENKVNGEINVGFLVLLGIGKEDSFADIDYLVRKISNLRVFSDENGKMNLSVLDIDGECLVVSQFTLFANTKKGNRPSFILSAPPSEAIPLYEQFVNQLSMTLGKDVPTGKFGANMQISLINDGPVTIFIDSKNKE